MTNNVKSSSRINKATDTSTGTSNSGRFTVRQFAIMNSQARSGTVEGDFVKRALTALTRSSSQKQCPRRDFHPEPSRLSVMSRAEDS
ncbi:unnamed protein product [Coffea canephora]|uniref:Uncharacterized protein n=1 Tax=Coffea canephora TaxID=49390 RepID=A0A068UDL1_COFCA|nr:unnamed protein product [Coffea canephora]